MFHFLSFIGLKKETDKEGFWANIKNVRSQCKQHCKSCIILWFIIQGLNSHVAPHTDSLQTMWIWLRSVSFQRLVTWRSQYCLRCISTAIKGIFRNIHIVYPNFICWHFGFYKLSFPICCVFKNSSHFSSTDVTTFILRRCRIVCAACGTVWSGCGYCVCWVWDSVERVWVLCVLSVGQCGAGVVIGCVECGTVWSLCGYCVCWVWDSVERVWLLCVLSVGQFGAGMRIVCVECG